MTKKAGDAEFQKKVDLVMEHCVDQREWKNPRIGNLSREDVVFLFGENFIAGLDKQPVDTNCPYCSSESYTDPYARDDTNPEIEYYASIDCTDARGRKLGTLTYVDGNRQRHYLFDRVEKFTKNQKIRMALQGIATNNLYIKQANQKNEQLVKQLDRLLKNQISKVEGNKSVTI